MVADRFARVAVLIAHLNSCGVGAGLSASAGRAPCRRAPRHQAILESAPTPHTAVPTTVCVHQLADVVHNLPGGILSGADAGRVLRVPLLRGPAAVIAQFVRSRTPAWPFWTRSRGNSGSIRSQSRSSITRCVAVLATMGHDRGSSSQDHVTMYPTVAQGRALAGRRRWPARGGAKALTTTRSRLVDDEAVPAPGNHNRGAGRPRGPGPRPPVRPRRRYGTGIRPAQPAVPRR
jgi:hypothetical protein